MFDNLIEKTFILSHIMVKNKAFQISLDEIFTKSNEYHPRLS